MPPETQLASSSLYPMMSQKIKPKVIRDGNFLQVESPFGVYLSHLVPLFVFLIFGQPIGAFNVVFVCVEINEEQPNENKQKLFSQSSQGKQLPSVAFWQRLKGRQRTGRVLQCKRGRFQAHPGWHKDAGGRLARSGASYWSEVHTAGPSITLFHSVWFITTLMKCGRNFTLVYINQPMIKLILLYAVSLKVTEHVNNVK